MTQATLIRPAYHTDAVEETQGEDTMPGERGQAKRPHQISITLPDAILADVQTWANAKAIPAATLIRQWVAERVAQERQQAEARRDQLNRP